MDGEPRQIPSVEKSKTTEAGKLSPEASLLRDAMSDIAEGLEETGASGAWAKDRYQKEIKKAFPERDVSDEDVVTAMILELQAIERTRTEKQTGEKPLGWLKDEVQKVAAGGDYAGARANVTSKVLDRLKRAEDEGIALDAGELLKQQRQKIEQQSGMMRSKETGIKIIETPEDLLASVRAIRSRIETLRAAGVDPKGIEPLKKQRQQLEGKYELLTGKLAM